MAKVPGDLVGDGYPRRQGNKKAALGAAFLRPAGARWQRGQRAEWPVSLTSTFSSSPA